MRSSRFLRKLAAARTRASAAGWSEASLLLTKLATSSKADRSAVPDSARGKILAALKTGLKAHNNADTAARRIQTLTTQETAARSEAEKLHTTLTAAGASAKASLRESSATHTLRHELGRRTAALARIRSEIALHSRRADEALEQSRSCLRDVETLTLPRHHAGELPA